MAWAALTVGLALPVGAAEQAMRAPAAGGSVYRVAGKVVNATSGEPVRRATVALLSEDDGQLVESTQTDSEGQFALEGVPAGKHPLTASRRGYRTSFFDEHDDFNSAIVTGPGQDTAHLVFRLTPNSVLYGSVSGDGGDPVEGASVLLFERGGTHDGPEDRINEVDATTTDDTGAYEFANLGPGEYMIAVSAMPWYALPGKSDPNRASDASPLDVAYPVTYYDSTTEEASATPIRLQEGVRQKADISMHATPALRLRVNVPLKNKGIARPELKKMVFGAQIAAESTGFLDVLRDRSAEFTGLAPGHYELVQGDPPRVSNFDLAASEEVDPNSGVPAVSVSGTLVGTDGSPLTEAATAVLEPVGEPRGRATTQAPVRKGTFFVDAVEPGDWALSVITPSTSAQSQPVIAIGLGGASASAGNQITVKEQPLTLRAVVSRASTRVLGFAHDDHQRGMMGVMVVLVPRQAASYRALVRRDQSDSDGSFALRDVSPGQYTAIAIDDGWKLDWTRRETMLRYLAGGVPVTVPEHAGAAINLPVAITVQPR